MAAYRSPKPLVGVRVPRGMPINNCMEWFYIDKDLKFAQEILSRSKKHGIIACMYISGPFGTVKAHDIGYVYDGYYNKHPDRLWDLYKSILLVLDGHYHCCLSGKVWNL